MKTYSEEQLMNNLFYGCSAWRCNICGKLVETDVRQLQSHLLEHTTKEINKVLWK